jgi:hypothetical protein
MLTSSRFADAAVLPFAASGVGVNMWLAVSSNFERQFNPSAGWLH